jgi:hypothetical protein
MSDSAKPKLTLSRNLWIAAGAAALVMLGTLLSWASVFGISVAGTQTGDGKAVLVISACTAVLVLVTPRWRWACIVAAVGGAVTAAICIHDWAGLSNAHANFFGTKIGASVGMGLVLDTIASFVVVVATVLHWLAQRRAKQAAPLAATPIDAVPAP